MTDLRIRDAVRADTEALLAIYRPFVVETAVSFEFVPPSLAEFEQRIVAAQSEWAWLVAERGTESLGYAYAAAFRTRAAYQWSVETSAYVHPAHHGQGVAKALYARLLTVLAEKGYCTAYAGITLPNEASVRLHRSLGFGEVGVFRRAGRKFGKWHDVSWWQRELREKPPTE
ncbi:MAG TPA: GNAT family N-acetyltransferase [Vicinamibacteria bacterium]|nr:GNAT family N-acetyltransferase [Vicinamibacteria bacterium]